MVVLLTNSFSTDFLAIGSQFPECYFYEWKCESSTSNFVCGNCCWDVVSAEIEVMFWMVQLICRFCRLNSTGREFRNGFYSLIQVEWLQFVKCSQTFLWLFRKNEIYGKLCHLNIKKYLQIIFMICFVSRCYLSSQ